MPKAILDLKSEFNAACKRFQFGADSIKSFEGEIATDKKT